MCTSDRSADRCMCNLLTISIKVDGVRGNYLHCTGPAHITPLSPFDEMPSEYHPLPSQSPPIEYIEDKDIEQDTQATSHAALPHSWRHRVYLWALLVSLFVNLLQWTIGTQHSAAPHTLDQNPQWFVEDPLFCKSQYIARKRRRSSSFDSAGSRCRQI